MEFDDDDDFIPAKKLRCGDRPTTRPSDAAVKKKQEVSSQVEGPASISSTTTTTPTTTTTRPSSQEDDDEENNNEEVQVKTIVTDTELGVASVIAAFEKESISKFVVGHQDANYAKEDWKSKQYLNWKLKNVPTGNVPGIYLGRREYDCHQGKDKKIGKKKKWKLEQQKKGKSDHCHIKGHFLTQPTKKVNCPAKIIVKKVALFPDFEANSDSKKERCRMKSKFQECKTNSEINLQIKYYVILPNVNDHKFHLVGENIMSSNSRRSVLCSQRLKKFSGFIEQLGLSGKDLNVIWLNDYLQRQDKFSEEIEGFLCTSYHLHIIDDQFLSALPNLKVVSIASAGYDNLDVSKLHKLNIRMSNVQGFGSEPTADIAFMLMLATARRLKANMQISKNADEEVRKSSLFSILGTDVTGATLGILGMGGIGYAIAKRAVGFRMNTLYYNRTRRSEADEERVNAKYCTSLTELLNLSDFFVIAVPLTKETTNLIGHKELDLMKPTSILINVARGRIVDTNALVDALKNGKISAAGLDVTDPEPLAPDHPLVHMENVVLSGHSGTSTQETRSKIFIQAIDNLKAGLNSGQMSNELFPSSS